MATYVAYTAYVDSTFGVAHPQLQNANAPFLTIMLAITAILNSTSPPSLFQQWNIEVAPGTYFEDPTLPGFTNLIGSGTATSLVGTLTVTGAGIVRDLLINANNAPAVIVNRPINIGDAAFVNVVIVASFSGNFTGPVAAVDVLIGDCTFESGALFSSFSGFGPKASGVQSTGGLALFNVLTSFSTSGGFDRAFVFSVEGDKTAITECVVNADFNGGNRAAIVEAHNITASVKENRITVSSSTTAEVAVVNAGDSAVVLLTNNYIDFSAVPTANAVLARGRLSAVTRPDVRFLGNAFVQTQIPPSVGLFNQLSYDLFDEEGSFKFSGGLYGKIMTVCGEYNLQTSDSTLIVNCAHTRVYLPSGNAGQIITVKNIYAGPAHVKNNIFDGDVTLRMEDAVTMQSDGTQWYILSDYN